MATPKLQAAARLLAKAEAVRANADLPDHKRAHDYCSLMLQWATSKIREDPKHALQWSRESAEWSKREQVAMKSLDQMKLDQILAAIEAFRRDGDALTGLE
jgi:hypothetical protein